jgi:uncharacterized membrane protein HdeD (DUF308 family)
MIRNFTICTLQKINHIHNNIPEGHHIKRSLMKKANIANITGAIFIILGALSIAYPFYSSLGIEAFFGALFLFGGIFHLFGAFEEKHRDGYIWNFVVGALYILAGVYLLSHPLIGLLFLSLLLIALFYTQGILTIIFGFQQRKSTRYWIWSMISGLLSIGIATLLVVSYPISALWVFGVLVGINLLIFGISLLLLNPFMSKS